MWATGALLRTAGALLQTAEPYCSPLGPGMAREDLAASQGALLRTAEVLLWLKGSCSGQQGLLQPAARGGPTAARGALVRPVGPCCGPPRPFCGPRESYCRLQDPVGAHGGPNADRTALAAACRGHTTARWA